MKAVEDEALALTYDENVMDVPGELDQLGVQAGHVDGHVDL